MIKIKTLFSLLSVFTFTLVYGQQDTTILYSKSNFEKDPIRSNFKRSVAKRDSLWELSLLNRKGVLQETICFADEELTIRQGPYALYNDGNLAGIGNYNKGYKVGEWTDYEGNSLSGKHNYTWGKLDGVSRTYWNGGQLKEESNYIRGKRYGERKMFYVDGKLAVKEVYEDGKKVNAAFYDHNDNQIDAFIMEQPPMFPGGMKEFYQYLGRTIRYPSNAIRNKISGAVFISFVVKKDGYLEDIQVMKSPDDELSREARRVIQMSPKWIPGTMLGEAVNVRYNIPIKFSIP